MYKMPNLKYLVCLFGIIASQSALADDGFRDFSEMEGTSRKNSSKFQDGGFVDYTKAWGKFDTDSQSYSSQDLARTKLSSTDYKQSGIKSFLRRSFDGERRSARYFSGVNRTRNYGRMSGVRFQSLNRSLGASGRSRRLLSRQRKIHQSGSRISGGRSFSN